MPSDDPAMKVCIIGAGFSGLSCAYHLLKANASLDIQILEARDRIGGRVFPLDISKDPSDPVMVDMGGQWIHEASKRNPLIPLLQEIDVPLLYAKNRAQRGDKTPDEKPDCRRLPSGTYLSDGTRIPDHVFKKARRFYYKTLNEYNERDIDEQTSYQDLLDDACKEAKISSTSSSLDVFQQVLAYLSHRTEIFEGGRMAELSVELDELYQEFGGPNEIAEGGYHAVLCKVADCIGRERIRLNCPVQDIHYEPLPGTTTTTSNDNGPGVKIEFQDSSTKTSQTLLADYCVCTVPLGVLKKRAIHFHPPLPPAHEKSIDAMGMGILDKVMMLFETQFWDEDMFVGIAPEDSTRIQNFCDCSEDYNGKPVLAMLFGGDCSRRFDSENGLSDDEVIAEALVSLRTLFGKDVVPEPVSFKVSRWLLDPYAYGAYSFAQIGSTKEDYEQVAQPGGRNLFFAGEHTNTHHHSTVHGAWETGKREADRLINLASGVKV